jgi:hypothetical protein
MPRQNRRVDCAAVQGEGAFMVVQALTFGEREQRWLKADLLQRVVEWNWTDAHDEPLPLPHDEAAIKLLDDWELDFVCDSLVNPVTKADAKN